MLLDDDSDAGDTAGVTDVDDDDDPLPKKTKIKLSGSTKSGKR